MNECNEFVIFEEYVKFVCKNIMSVKKRNEVREELYSHLFEEYDRNVALGYDDLSAQQKAIEKMGDKEKIADDFGKIYSVIPNVYMRLSLNFIIWGILLNHFKINLFTGLGEITGFIGEMLLIFGLFKLRKTDKKINRALFLNLTINFIGIILRGISLYMVDASELKFIWAVISSLLATLTYWWIFSGIKNLCETIITEKDKKPKLYLGFTMMALFFFSIIFAYLLEFSLIATISPILLIVALCQLGRAKNVLSHQEPEFELKQSLNKAEKAIYWVLIVVLAVTPMVTMFASAIAKPDCEVYNSADTNTSQEEINYAKEHMLKLGFPKEYLKDLPDSEILKYSDATYLQIEKAYEHKEKDVFYNEKPIANSQIFNFYYDDAEMRILIRVDIPNNSVIKYRSGVYFNFYDRDFTPLYDGNGLGDYGKLYLALAEENGKTISYKPLSEYSPKSSIENFYTSGFEFNFKNSNTNKRVYIAHSARISNPTIAHYMWTDGVLLWQQFPISADEKSINDMAREYLNGTIYFSNDLDKINKRQLYNSPEFEEHYIIEDELVDFDALE